MQVITRWAAPKSYQLDGQLRKTENEFSYDHLMMIHRESDDLGNSKMAVFYVLKKYDRPNK